MENEKPVVELTQYHSGSFYYAIGIPAELSRTKVLGGKENVAVTRYWTHHGSGGWIYEWRVKDLQKAKQSILDFGFDYKITKGVDVLEDSRHRRNI